ncbi:MAG: hypothetical protein K8T10_20635 [Candidatus Eremiobacteraeota bacterium]|nr:hypothetical protein [Candidatus Eremiobacteraeota bacterium]
MNVNKITGSTNPSGGYKPVKTQMKSLGEEPKDSYLGNLKSSVREGAFEVGTRLSEKVLDLAFPNDSIEDTSGLKTFAYVGVMYGTMVPGMIIGGTAGFVTGIFGKNLGDMFKS